MSSSLITTILNGQLQQNGLTRFTQTNANLSVNGCLLDFSVVPNGNWDNPSWDFLKTLYINLTKRIGSGDGGSVAVLNNVCVYDLMSYSDYKAGVSMESTIFTQGEKARVSGYIDLGFFVMSSRDALEVSLNVEDPSLLPTNSNVNFEICTVFDNVEVPNYIVYQSNKPTGADQPYKNVLELFYVGKGQNADCSITDMSGTKIVNINSAIALSNARGKFEFFTDFGRLYQDSFDLSQDISYRCPIGDGSSSILVRSMAFYPQETTESMNEVLAERNSVLEKIKSQDIEKYQYLQKLGIV